MDENITLNLTNDENPKKEALVEQTTTEIKAIKKEEGGELEKPIKI